MENGISPNPCWFASVGHCALLKWYLRVRVELDVCACNCVCAHACVLVCNDHAACTHRGRVYEWYWASAVI